MAAYEETGDRTHLRRTLGFVCQGLAETPEYAEPAELRLPFATPREFKSDEARIIADTLDVSAD